MTTRAVALSPGLTVAAAIELQILARAARR